MTWLGSSKVVRHARARLGVSAALVGAWLVCASSDASAQPTAPAGDPSAAPSSASAAPVDEPQLTPLLPPLPRTAATTPPVRSPSAQFATDPRRKPLVWDPEWRKFGGVDYWLTGAAGLVLAATAIVPPLRRTLAGNNQLDDGARDAFRLSDLGDRGTATDISDVLLTSLSSYPLMVDALVVARWYRQSPKVAWELFMMDMEVLMVTGAIQGTATVLAGRERPYGPTCGTELDRNMRDCLSTNRYRSFFSGHASQSFASASLICIHHAYFPLYGGGFADVAPCALGMLTAAGTAWLRIASDFHHASDVLTGALVGTLTGFGLPWLLHYRRRPAADASTSTGPRWMVLPAPLGISVGGFF